MEPAPSTSQPDPHKSLGFLLDASAAFLEKRRIQSPRLAAELLAARLLKCRRLDLPLHVHSMMPDKHVEALRRGILRVGTGEPIQYVLGQWDFRKLTLKTDQRALVPRPETEELVQLLLDCIPLRAQKNLRIMDFGTGTGCIALSIASELPGARVIAVDVSEDALALARENAEALNLSDRVSFLNSETVDLADVLEPGSLDAIISNPPYIPTESYNRLADSVKKFEPQSALDGGPDGMVVTRQLIEDSTLLLASGGYLFLELSAEDDQARPLGRYLSEVGFDNIKAHRDINGKDRFLSGSLAEGL